MPQEKDGKIIVTGKIFRIFFKSADFVIAKITTKEGYVSIKGNMRALDIEKFDKERKDVTFIGTMETHPKYGEQLKVDQYHEYSIVSSNEINPSTLAKFISDNLVGVGPVRAAQVVTNAGGCDALIETIENHPEDLVRYHDYIGALEAADLSQAWETEKSKMGVLSFFADHGITGTFPHKIYAQYGEGAINTVKTDPYILIDQVENIGFKRADEIAMKLGIKRDAPVRIRAAIIYALQVACEQAGNCFLTEMELLMRSKKILGLSGLYVQAELGKMLEAGLLTEDEEQGMTPETEKILVDDGKIYLKHFYKTECKVAEEITEMLS